MLDPLQVPIEGSDEHLVLGGEVSVEGAAEDMVTELRHVRSWRLAPELADAFVLLVALASANDIDLEAAVAEKFFGTDSQRSWRSAGT